MPGILPELIPAITRSGSPGITNCKSMLGPQVWSQDKSGPVMIRAAGSGSLRLDPLALLNLARGNKERQRTAAVQEVPTPAGTRMDVSH